MEEDFADNAFVYASVQMMKIGKREDGWHTDGGASLLHAGLTLFGSRTLLINTEDDTGCISLPQKPGSFYIGNLCALEHNVLSSFLGFTREEEVGGRRECLGGRFLGQIHINKGTVMM